MSNRNQPPAVPQRFHQCSVAEVGDEVAVGLERIFVLGAEGKHEQARECADPERQPPRRVVAALAEVERIALGTGLGREDSSAQHDDQRAEHEADALRREHSRYLAAAPCD